MINPLMCMDDIKLFIKNEKELVTLMQTIRIYSHDIRMEFDIEKCAILILKSGKREITEGIELPNQEKIRTLGVKEKDKYSQIRSEYHQTSRDKRKNNKRVPQKNEKTSGNQTQPEKSRHKDKHLGSPPCEILGIIYKMDLGGIQTNGPKDKEINVNEEGFTHER